jgi:micrococcal nuclease
MELKCFLWKSLLATLILLLATLACGGSKSMDDVSGRHTLALPAPLTSTPGEQPSAAATTQPSRTAPSLVEAQVTHVVDGDTIGVRIDGVEYRLRYIGIDAPETKYSPRGAEPFGSEASQANSELVEGKTVLLEKDVSETDRYGRLLRYVYVGDMMVNEELLRRGMARVVTFPPDVKYHDRFLDAQRAARIAGLGIWGVEPTPTGVSRGDVVSEAWDW